MTYLNLDLPNICTYSYTKVYLPTPLMDMFITNTDTHLHNTRNVNNPHIQSRITKIAQKSLRHMGPIIWYKIHIKQVFRECQILQSPRQYVYK